MAQGGEKGRILPLFLDPGSSLEKALKYNSSSS